MPRAVFRHAASSQVQLVQQAASELSRSGECPKTNADICLLAGYVGISNAPLRIDCNRSDKTTARLYASIVYATKADSRRRNIHPFEMSFAELPLDKNGPHGNAWGKWGPNDQLGTLHYLTDDVVSKAAGECIKSGQRISLK